MKAIIHPAAFSNDHDDRILRSGQSLPSEPARATLNTFEPSMNDSEEPRVARWDSTDKRPKPQYNPAAVAATEAAVNSPITRTLVAAAPAVNEAVVTATLLGQPNGYSRSEEVIEETDSYRIARSSYGTIRTDLHCRPELKAVQPVVKTPNPSIGRTLTQEEIDQL